MATSHLSIVSTCHNLNCLTCLSSWKVKSFFLCKTRTTLFTVALHMAISLSTTLQFLTLNSSKSTLTSILTIPTTRYQFSTITMNLCTTKSEPVTTSSASSSSMHHVPEQDSNEMERIFNQTFQRYSSNNTKRSGKGTAIVWFRNDLRVLDNEALYKAWISSQTLLPVYCIDPRLFATTHYFGFPKTGGTLFPAYILLCCYWYHIRHWHVNTVIVLKSSL
jgi:deoxyribodipyrimidine photo-lyase